MEKSLATALESYGFLGIVAILLIAAFVWYTKTADKGRGELQTKYDNLEDAYEEMRKERNDLYEQVMDLKYPGRNGPDAAGGE